MSDYYLIKSGHKEYYPYWEQEGIVSVGWNKAAGQIVGDVSDKEVLESIEGRYDQSPGYVLSVVKCFAGRNHKSRTPMKPGDVVIIIGQRKIRGRSVIRGVAEVGEVNWAKERVAEDFPHRLHRDVTEWKYNDGPVVRNELSPKFRPKGDSSTHLPNTLQQWNPKSEDCLDELVEELNDSPKIRPKSYDFEFDESIIQAHIADNSTEFQKNAGVVSEEFRKEYQTETKQFADFVFLSNDSETTVVETKIGAAGPGAVRQLKRYVRDISAERGGDVSGVLVAEDFYDYDEIEAEIGDSDITLQRYRVTLEYDQVTLKS